MLWAGQNKNWGSIEEATRTWKEAGVGHVMVKHFQDVRLIDEHGSLVEETIKKLSRLQKEFGVEYHFHPYNLKIKNSILTPTIKETRPVLKKFLQDLDRHISKHGFYPLITLHLPVIKHPKYSVDVDEEKALGISRDFFQDLNLESKLALETMHAPRRNSREPNVALLGYKPEHFTKTIGEKKYGLCIDTGHQNLMNEETQSFLELLYPIHSVHLHGNDWHEDSHIMPTKFNVRDLTGALEAIRKCKGPVVLELNKHYINYSKEDIRAGIDLWTGLVQEY